jgi:all-trans-8'-apo-beta-carotenal 15,15'-oxygenase
MATADHLVLLVSPMRLVIHRAVLAVGDFSDLFRWTPEDGTEVIVVPIDSPERVRRFRIDPFFQIHFCGGFEESDGVAVDIMAYPDSSALERNVSDIDRPPECGVVTRVHIPHGAEHVHKERLCQAQMEFGKIDTRIEGERHRHLFGLTVDEGHRFALVHVDLDTAEEEIYWFPDDEFPSEALFVPRGPDADEGDGYLTTVVYRKASHTSYFAMLDTRDLTRGPITRAHFDHHIPAGFHGTWVPAQ